MQCTSHVAMLTYTVLCANHALIFSANVIWKLKSKQTIVPNLIVYLHTFHYRCMILSTKIKNISSTLY